MPTYAAIDIGTNSMKLLVGSIEPAASEGSGYTITTMAEELVVTRLGEGLAATGRLSPEAIDRNVSQLAAMAEKARAMGAAAIAVVGTMALREAANADTFLRLARSRCQLEVEIISGEEEGRLAFLGALSGLHATADTVFCVFDTGGGSTEFMLGEAGRLREHFSITLGVREMTERYLHHDPPLPEEIRALQGAIVKRLADAGDRIAVCHEGSAAGPDASTDRNGASSSAGGFRLVGMGGTVTTLAAVRRGMKHYDPRVIAGTILDRREIHRQMQLYSSLPLSRRKEIDGLEPDRADVMLAGAAIVAAVIDRLGCDELEVNDRGLRHGLLLDRFAPGSGRP